MQVQPNPPSDFCKKLYDLDANLFIRWHPGTERWSVWWLSPDDGHIDHVVTAVEPNGDYRPLDDRTLKIIKMNRYYAEHPDELNKVLLTDPEEANKRSEERTQENIKLLQKDKALMREWSKTVDKIKSIDWQTWSRPRVVEEMVHPETGERKKIWWNPHPDLKFSRKPTTGEAEEIINEASKLNE